MLGISNPQTFIFGTLLVVLAPGVNSLFVLALASKHNQKIALFAMLGILTGDSFLMLIAVLGGQSLVSLYPDFFLGIKILGASYLAWLGVGLIYRGIKDWTTILKYDLKKSEKQLTPKHAYIKACLLSLSNPKAILFFATFFLQFIDPTYLNKALSFFIQALIVLSISISYLLFLIFLGKNILGNIKHKSRWQSILQILVGTFFCVYAGKFLWDV